MDSLVYKINLDCLRKDSQAIVNAKVGETNGRKIVFTLYEGRSAFFVPEGATAIFRAKKPSGAVLYNSCDINDGKVEYTLTQQTVAEQGVFPCEIQIVGADNKIIYTPCITLDVAQNLYSDAEVESTSEFTALTGAIDEVRALKAFTIKLTTTNDGITADKTFAEIAEKVNSAKSVIVNMDGWAFPVSYIADSGKIVFSSLWANIAEIPNAVTFAVNSSDVWNVVVSDIPTTAQVSAKYTKPASGIPKTDLANDVQASLNKADTALQEHQSLAAYRTAAAQDIIDNTKQDKLIAGENITIADDGKTISAAANGVGVLEVTLTTQNGVSVADKTFEQVKAAVDSGIPVLKVHSDGALLWFFLLDKSPTEIDFVGLVDEQIIAYLTAKQDNTWETTVAARVTAEMLSSLNDKIGNIGQLTTTDKTNLVAAVNEVKQTADDKQDKLIAGDNITITEDGTISATGGSDIETVESQLVDIPSKLSQLTNDAGYLTLDTLPKYDGSVT